MKGNSPAAQLLRALVRRAGAGAALDHDGETPWSSVTFVGAQHRVAVTGDTSWTATLDETDLPMRGHFVASIGVTPTAGGEVLTVLVLEE